MYQHGLTTDGLTTDGLTTDGLTTDGSTRLSIKEHHGSMLPWQIDEKSGSVCVKLRTGLNAMVVSQAWTI